MYIIYIMHTIYVVTIYICNAYAVKVHYNEESVGTIAYIHLINSVIYRVFCVFTYVWINM